MRSRNFRIGLIILILAVMPATWIRSGTGNDLPVGGQQEVKLRSMQEIFGGECCVRDAGKDIDGLAAAGIQRPGGHLVERNDDVGGGPV